MILFNDYEDEFDYWDDFNNDNR